MLKVLRHVALLGNVGMEILDAESIDGLGVEEYVRVKASKEKMRVVKRS